MKDCLASSRCERLSLVAICTARSSLLIALKVTSGSDIATARLPPRQTSAFERPSRIASIASIGIVALVARRLEAEHAGQSIQQCIVRDLGNADGAVSLHIGVAAQRRNAGALAPDIAAQHQQIGDLLHIARAVAMLGDAHAVVDDDPLRLGVDVADVLDIRSRQTRGLLDRVPGGRVEVGQQRVDPGGMILDEVAIENTGAAFGEAFCVERQQGFIMPFSTAISPPTFT